MIINTHQLAAVIDAVIDLSPVVPTQARMLAANAAATRRRKSPQGDLLDAGGLAR